MATFSHAQLAKEARRELVQRARLYPHLVSTGRIIKPVADERLAMMTAIAEYFEEQDRIARGQTELFGESRADAVR